MGKITFERPPLIEVSFGLHFAPLRDFRTAHFGAFWSRLRPNFVETADKPVVADNTTSPVVFGGEWFPLPRVWYVHKDKEQILQLQSDRFYFNWRRVSESGLYPRFDSLEPVFVSYVEQLRSFVSDESLGALDIVGCELAYTNHIFRGEGWTDPSDIGEVFPRLLWAPSSALGRPTALAWQGAFKQDNVSLSADVKYGHTRDDPKRDLFIFELRTKSRQKLTTMETVQAALSASNQAIVNAFVDLTSDRMQREYWKRAS